MRQDVEEGLQDFTYILTADILNSTHFQNDLFLKIICN